MRQKATATWAPPWRRWRCFCAMFATSASAAPAWKFEGKSLEGTEAVLGGAIESSMTSRV